MDSKHYKYTERFHGNYEGFIRQKKRDNKKNIICRDRDITLIRIPYMIKNKDIVGYLREILNCEGIIIPNNVYVDYTKIKTLFAPKQEKYEELKGIIESKGGILISEQYIGKSDEIEVKCDKGHMFKSSYENIKLKGMWCTFCRHKN